MHIRLCEPAGLSALKGSTTQLPVDEKAAPLMAAVILGLETGPPIPATHAAHSLAQPATTHSSHPQDLGHGLGVTLGRVVSVEQCVV